MKIKQDYSISLDPFQCSLIELNVNIGVKWLQLQRLKEEGGNGSSRFW